ncbi:MAG: hypothetical protein A3F35_00680 [Candidatus Woykebacteria bacterium RIFCSPHIGHO2_12_FULL_45_10]|uniref:Uncharacterized protein n=1 Tax=Candidatus Woykebacteria bacterium RIFCSPHIGHO2_12_FULL_45_10 TaxID=1802603 RepID=A0A1G1WNE0_9BACT|nr:MAG: hypothetical protein A3F35_00680 [Candidatus Woykebacteria bacterium RIFCSPHIGHO2_12_FULL_45_10]
MRSATKNKKKKLVKVRLTTFGPGLDEVREERTYRRLVKAPVGAALTFLSDYVAQRSRRGSSWRRWEPPVYLQRKANCNGDREIRNPSVVLNTGDTLNIIVLRRTRNPNGSRSGRRKP